MPLILILLSCFATTSMMTAYELFSLLWTYTELLVSFWSGAGLGFEAGIPGMIVWIIFFKNEFQPSSYRI